MHDKFDYLKKMNKKLKACKMIFNVSNQEYRRFRK